MFLELLYFLFRYAIFRGELKVERRGDLEVFLVAVGQLHGHAERFYGAAVVRDGEALRLCILQRGGRSRSKTCGVCTA